MKNLISCTAWVSRGIAAKDPAHYDVNEGTLERISKLAGINIEEARAELEKANAAAEEFEGVDREDEEDSDGDEEQPAADADADGDVSMDDASEKPNTSSGAKIDDLAEYKLDDYDEERTETNIFSNVNGLAYYPDNSKDPYVTIDDEADEEREELEIRASDNLIVAAKTEDHVSSLEIYVYDETEDNLYAHHDILLPSFPICLEWLDFPPSASTADSDAKGNYVAVGTLDPEIEIWSLDVIEGMYPDALLGRPSAPKETEKLSKNKKKKEKRKPPKSNPDFHVDSVLGLSWNRAHRNLLASASADKTVKLWDLSRELDSPAIRSFDVHKDKVQAVHWNALEPTVLLTGSYDRTVRTFDSRSPDSGLGATLPSDVEALKWDPWGGQLFYVSLENGLVLNYDARTLPSDLKTPVKPIFQLQAHDGPASGMDINPHVRGLIATGGQDELVKLWNINAPATETTGSVTVSALTSRNLDVGKVFSVTWSPDDPLTLAAAGSQGRLQVWDVGSKQYVRKALEDKLPQREWKERENDGIIGVDSGDDDDSSGDEDAWEDE